MLNNPTKIGRKMEILNPNTSIVIINENKLNLLHKMINFQLHEREE
jgi:hypothetical protein